MSVTYLKRLAAAQELWRITLTYVVAEEPLPTTDVREWGWVNPGLAREVSIMFLDGLIRRKGIGKA